jgi:hypothetical protein
VARELGVSRQCAHRWVARYAAGGPAGLADRSSRPHRMPARTSQRAEALVVDARRRLRAGPAFLAPVTGVPERTISRILRRAGMPRLADCDPLTGQLIRSAKSTAIRYERSRPGELVHLDVKKLGRIPDGGGWRSRGRPGSKTHAARNARIGFRLHPRRRRRPLPAGLRRDPARRERRHRGRIPHPRRRPVRHRRNPRD